jgi:hypothetical protein
MKIKKFISFTLKVIGYVLGITGAFLVIGSVGKLEWDEITIAQFCLRELLAWAMIFGAIVVYYIRDYFNWCYIK